MRGSAQTGEKIKITIPDIKSIYTISHTIEKHPFVTKELDTEAKKRFYI